METKGEEAALRYLQGAAGKNAPQVIRAMYDQGLLREVRSAREWEKIFERGVRQGAGLDVHHLIERRFAERLELRESEIPAVVLDRTFHQQEVTARLFSRDFLPTNRDGSIFQGNMLTLFGTLKNQADWTAVAERTSRSRTSSREGASVTPASSRWLCPARLPRSNGW